MLEMKRRGELFNNSLIIDFSSFFRCNRAIEEITAKRPIIFARSTDKIIFNFFTRSTFSANALVLLLGVDAEYVLYRKTDAEIYDSNTQADNGHMQKIFLKRGGFGDRGVESEKSDNADSY